MKTIITILVLTLLALSAQAATAGRFFAVSAKSQWWTSVDSKRWEQCEPQPHLNIITNPVATAFGISIQPTTNGYVRTSMDGGKTWTIRNTGLQSHLKGVATDGHAIIVVGNEGAIARSVDGLTWEPQKSPSDARLRAVTYGGGIGGKFVAVGDDETILTSKDGRSWTKRRSQYQEPKLLAVLHASDIYIAAGERSRMYRSRTGKRWKDVSPKDSQATFTILAYLP